MKLFLLLSTFLVSALTANMPARFKKCNYKDNVCLKDSLQDALGKISKGVPELKVPSIDPLVVPELVVPAGSGIIKCVQHYKNLSLLGICSHKVANFTFDLEKGKLQLDATFEKISMEGIYQINGNVLVLPVEGNGLFSIRGEKGTTTLSMDFDTVSDKNEKHIKVKKISLILRPSHLTLQFDNLFNGNKMLGDNINKVLNDNWKDIFNELGPSYFEAFAQIIKNSSQIFFDAVPVSELFLDRS
ncbi:protein takeout-like [Harmonia axyridis]|uniref:protein takeout-like n=1 Tax=Harmonia axyridis TaxID=115357 RepID=UPI001E2765EA|nr:protein takeout-like [Harmonia axyridis]